MKPLEDSEDFTAEEAEMAILAPTATFVIQSADEAAQDQSVPIRYELRRRKPHMYCRALIGKPEAPDKVLVFRLDWLKEQNQDGM
jgi:hypothetical protein